MLPSEMSSPSVPVICLSFHFCLSFPFPLTPAPLLLGERSWPKWCSGNVAIGVPGTAQHGPRRRADGWEGSWERLRLFAARAARQNRRRNQNETKTNLLHGRFLSKTARNYCVLLTGLPGAVESTPFALRRIARGSSPATGAAFVAAGGGSTREQPMPSSVRHNIHKPDFRNRDIPGSLPSVGH